MVDSIMKGVDYIAKAVIQLQLVRQGWSGKTIKDTEIFIVYDEIVQHKADLVDLHKEFFQKKTSSTDQAHDATFLSVFSSIKTLQVDIGDLKAKRDRAAASRSKSTPFKLEKIKLPQFSGQFSEWQDFQDLFSSAVENNTNLSESEKMVYLKSSLTGEAATIVCSFSTASTSFTDAWDLVKKRFSNQREIVFSHIRKFDDLKPVQESSSGLRKLADSINECVRSLTALSIPVSYWDLILIYIALKKLDSESKKEWLLTQGVDLPKLKDFIEFLEKRATALADSQLKSKSSQQHHKSFEKSSHHASSSSSKFSDGKSCVKCGDPHYLHQCKVFSSLQPSERQRFVIENKLCFNCLFRGHSSKNCKIKSKCKQCHSRHHTLIHQNYKPKESNSQSTSSQNSAPASEVQLSNFNTISSSVTSVTNSSSCHAASNDPAQHHVVLFETGIGLAEDSSGQRQSCRIFFDAGSEVHFITENCVDRLGLQRKRTCVQVDGIGGVDGGTVNVHAMPFTMPRIECKSSFTHLQGLQLADPMFYSPAPIDILIGVPLTGKVKLPGIIVGPTGLPDAQNSIFGWVISGNAPSSSSQISSSFQVRAFHTSCSVHEPCLSSSLQKFWESEEPEFHSSSCAEDEQAELHFQSTVSRTSEGRYCVSLPFKSSVIELGESKPKAIRRLYSVEKSLSKNPDMFKSYHQQFSDFIKNGLIEKVPAAEVNSKLSYYMPHHVVSKLESISTKYRIVFDASCDTSNGLSLNDILFTGPKIQVDLVPILLKFRTYAVAMSADIVKFYNQFCVKNPDTNFQRLVYRSSANEPIQHYRFLRVCFGVTTAPYLAVRCLHQLADDYKDSHPLVHSILKKDFLIDNLLSGAATATEAIDIQSQLIDVLSNAQLQLKKWASNRQEVIESVPAADRESLIPCLINENSSVRTIGLLWNPVADSLSVKLYEPTVKCTATKRQVLSSIAKTFDPLGWLAPITIRLKILLQCLWKENLTWDQDLPQNLYNKWYVYCSELPSLKQFAIPRCITSSSSSVYELHGFCDASNHAYAACVYLKVNSFSSLIVCKTKVAPVKGETIPRLELCGAWLLAKLINSTLPCLELNISTVQCWTDSNIVLGWLNSSDKLPVFVNNRVRSIHHLLPNCKWYHVKGEENPADLASRGISVSSFLNSQLWLHGPAWLSTIQMCHLTQQSQNVSSVSIDNSSWFQERILAFVCSCSDFMKMKRVIGLWFRYYNHLKKQHHNYLTTKELHLALIIIIRVVQQVSFPDEITRLSRQQKILNHLKSMSLFLDSHGILRVGGRLRRGFYNFDNKHPILLPRNHHLSIVITRFYHKIHLHAGPQLLLSLIREKFWIIRGPQMCSRVVRNCVTCCKADPKSLNQVIGQLPESRIMPSRPFTNVGVDYAGPYYLCVTPGRKPRIIKSYVCVFICLAVKAIHLEFAGDLSTPSYLGAFRRFIARRGLPSAIICDGGKNFVGAKNEVQEIQQFLSSSAHQQQLNNYFIQQEIKYKFNPPYGPHHGGIFEAAVKSMKYHLKRVINDRHLSIEEFITLLSQVEAALNSRPLTPLSSDANDFSFISPGHFLIGCPLLAEPQKDITESPFHHLTRWQLVQQMYQHFFRRWSKQYIQSLQQLPKWYHQQPNLGVGQLVLVQDPDSDIGPQQWRLGRISAVFPGKDGHVRVCDVNVPVTKEGKMKMNTYRRPIVRISPLPVK